MKYHRTIVLFLLISAALAMTALPSCGNADSPETEEDHHEETAAAEADHADYEDHEEHEDHDGHAHEELGLPHIDPVSLEGRKLRITATTAIVGDVVKAVAGDTADLTVLMSPGQNPHAYSPAPRDVAHLEEADLIFVNGFGLETEILEILEGITGPVVIPVSAGVEKIEAAAAEGHDGHDHGAVDPHVWFSPKSVLHWTENIAFALAAADPENHEAYEQAAAGYRHELDELDAEVTALTETVPPADRRLVTDHASVGYFARDYGYTVIGNIIPSVNDQAEPSARDMAELIRIVEEQEVRAIFVGGTAAQSVRRMAESVAVEIGRDIPVLTILTGSLTIEGNRGDSYIDFVRYNAEIIVEGLTP